MTPIEKILLQMNSKDFVEHVKITTAERDKLRSDALYTIDEDEDYFVIPYKIKHDRCVSSNFLGLVLSSNMNEERVIDHSILMIFSSHTLPCAARLVNHQFRIDVYSED